MSSDVVYLTTGIRYIALDTDDVVMTDPEDKMAVDHPDSMDVDSLNCIDADMSLDTFNEALNQAFLLKKPSKDYPWSTATHVKLHSLKIGTLILSCVTPDQGRETKYRSLPYRFTKQLQANLDLALIDTIWNELSIDADQFFIRPTWVQTLELLNVRGFYESFFRDRLTNFQLDENNNPNNPIGLVDCMINENGHLDLLFKAETFQDAESTVNRIMDQLDEKLDNYADILLDGFLRPLEKLGCIARERFDYFFEKYNTNDENFKVFVDEIAAKVNNLKLFLDPSQYVSSNDQLVRSEKMEPLVEDVVNVIYPLVPL